MRSFSELASLKGRVALVAGGAGALGQVVAGAFAEQGAAVAILDRPGAGAERVAGFLTEKYGVLATAIGADTSNDAVLRRVPQRVADSCGRLDALITVLSPGGRDLEAQLGAGMAEPLQLIRHALPALRLSGRGSVTVVGPGLAALAGWLASAATPDVRINAINATTWRGEDVKAACVFLASDLAAHVSGQCISISPP